MLLVSSVWALAVLAADGPSVAAFSTAAPGEPPPAWKFATLPNKTPTRYSVVDLDAKRVLKVESDGSYGNLIHATRFQPNERSALVWRWRVDQLVDAADIKTRAGDDAAAKMCVFFDFDADKLPLGERARLAVARTSAGQEVPTETLCYVWDNQLPPGTGLTNAFTKRIRFIVIESGKAKLGQWVAERRNLAADYQKMFGDESEGKLPEIVGIGISADADNTRGRGLAYVGDITLTP